MARYYFDVVHAGKRHTDGEGSMLTRVRDVESEARDTARELAVEIIRKGEKIDDDYMEVRDENGAVVLTLHFRDIIV